MSGRVNMLSALLAVQLIVIAAVLLTGPGYGEEDSGPFLDFDPEQVDELHITGDAESAEALVIRRTEDGWRLPGGLPADEGRVNEALDRLAGLRAPWPVATSRGAAARFEVTDDDFQRHLVLRAGGDTVVDLYTGTSPGYQQVHARRADDSAVFSVGLANFQFPTRQDDWLNKTLLQPRGEITRISREGAWTLARAEDGWQLDGGPANEQVAAELVRRLSQLRVSGTAQRPAAEASPAGVLVIGDDAGEQRLRLYAGAQDGDEFRVTSDRREGAFTVASFVAQQLLLDAEALQPPAEPLQPAAAPADDAAAAPADDTAAAPQ